MIPIQEGNTELRMHESHVLFLPVNVLTVWRASFLDISRGCSRIGLGD